MLLAGAADVVAETPVEVASSGTTVSWHQRDESDKAVKLGYPNPSQIHPEKQLPALRLLMPGHLVLAHLTSFSGKGHVVNLNEQVLIKYLGRVTEYFLGFQHTGHAQTGNIVGARRTFYR